MAANEILQEPKRIGETSDNHGARHEKSLHKEMMPVKKKIQDEIDRRIIASVKKEMEKPRLAASVRNALEAEAALAAKNLRTIQRANQTFGIGEL
jgi:hypothetical protein